MEVKMASNLLREIREKKGLTQVALGRQIKVAPQTICSVERGRLLPSPRLQHRLAKVLGEPVDKIFPSGEAQNDE
jgi:putative transcriptional regulator